MCLKKEDKVQVSGNEGNVVFHDGMKYGLKALGNGLENKVSG